MMMKDSTVVPAALKRVAYNTSWEQRIANAELAGLRDCEGCDQLIQCLAVFQQHSPDDDKQYLCILLE